MRIITLDENEKVIGAKTMNDGYDIFPGLQVGEIISDMGEIGQIMQPDGTFITPEPIPIEPQPTIEDRLTNIEDTQDLILLKIEGVIV